MKTPWCWIGRGVCPPGMDGDEHHRLPGGLDVVLARGPHPRGVASATSSQGRHRLLFEGELYNAEELGLALRGSMHAPGPGDSSDAALFLALLLEHGQEGLNLINGPFAFVLWDEERRRLLLGRDRFGMKTLFWREDLQGLAVASRMSPLLEALGGRRRLDSEGALDFLINGFTDQGERTMFAGLQQVPAGCLLELDLAGWKPGSTARQVRPWYSLPMPGTEVLPEQEAVDTFRGLLADSVRLRWRSHEPKALLLSAGLDSSTIAGLVATGPSSLPLRTYKAYLDSPLHDQPEHVTRVVEMTGALHRGTAIGPSQLFDSREQLLEALEQPYERSIIAAHWAVCGLIASDDIHVTLDGLGADEQLGGYRPWLKNFGSLQRGEEVRGLPFVSASRPPESFEREAPLGRLFGWLSPEFLERAIHKIQRENALVIRSFGELCRYHIHHGALSMLLMFNRCIGAALGQQARSPFMDHRLVEFSLGLGDRYKFVQERSKYILRRAAEGLVPEIVLRHVNKESYVDLEVGWLRGPGFERLKQEAARTAAEWPTLFGPKALEFPSGGQEPGKMDILRLWRVTCWGAWARRFGVEP